MIKQGTRVKFLPYFLDSAHYSPEERASRYILGKVVYVNEDHKFFMVQYPSGGVPMRESFKFCQLGNEVDIYG